MQVDVLNAFRYSRMSGGTASLLYHFCAKIDENTNYYSGRSCRFPLRSECLHDLILGHAGQSKHTHHWSVSRLDHVDGFMRMRHKWQAPRTRRRGGCSNISQIFEVVRLASTRKFAAKGHAGTPSGKSKIKCKIDEKRIFPIHVIPETRVRTTELAGNPPRRSAPRYHRDL